MFFKFLDLHNSFRLFLRLFLSLQVEFFFNFLLLQKFFSFGIESFVKFFPSKLSPKFIFLVLDIVGDDAVFSSLESYRFLESIVINCQFFEFGVLVFINVNFFLFDWLTCLNQVIRILRTKYAQFFVNLH